MAAAVRRAVTVHARRALGGPSCASCRVLSSASGVPPSPPPEEKKSLFGKVKSFFSKPEGEAKRLRDEKHEILMEHMRRSVFYDAKQSDTEKVGRAVETVPCALGDAHLPLFPCSCLWLMLGLYWELKQ